MSQHPSIDAHAIRNRAYEHWLERGCPTGSPELDWQAAERELATHLVPSSARARAGAVPATDPATARLPVRRAPRSIVMRSANGPAARLLVALVPEAARAVRRQASIEDAPPRAAARSRK